MKFVLANGSTLVTAEECRAIVRSVQGQVDFDFCPAWELLPSRIEFLDDLTSTWPDGTCVIMLVDDAPEKGYAGYHWSDAQGISQIFVFVRPILDGGTVLGPENSTSAESVSATVSHEIVETIADPDVNFWADDPSNKRSVCLETADPVQDKSYTIEALFNGKMRRVSVSDFVLPRWFDPNAKGGRFTYLDSVKGPFEITDGGYVIVRGFDGKERTIGAKPLWRQKALDPEKRRSGRRKKDCV